MSKYQNLDAWKISMQLVKEIYLLTRKYPKEEIYALTSQSKRAAVSVPSNIAEGMGRQYKKDTLQFLHIARGSLCELETLLNIAVMVEIISEDDFGKILPLLDQSMQVLNGLINYTKKGRFEIIKTVISPHSSANVHMLTTPEILKKVRELEIKSKRLTRHLFTGEYHSAFKGRGMLFKEVREYHHGDDIRFIDWNVSARFNHPFSKVFEEERELTVMLLVDVSASSLFGTTHARKKDLVTEMAAVLAFSAISNNDKVGVIFFSDKIEKFIPAKKGRDHVLFIVRELLTAEPKQKGTNLTEAFRRFTNSTKQKCIAFILSDFLDTNFEDALKVAGKKHDVIGVKVYDKMDMQLPDIGLMEIEDAESGSRKWIDTSDFLLRQNYQSEFFRYTEYCKSIFTKAGCDLLHIRTDEDYVKVLKKFFISRNS